ncbi:hypothetical protein PG989_016235 [Apiospora arundinis]
MIAAQARARSVNGRHPSSSSGWSRTLRPSRLQLLHLPPHVAEVSRQAAQEPLHLLRHGLAARPALHHLRRRRLYEGVSPEHFAAAAINLINTVAVISTTITIPAAVFITAVADGRKKAVPFRRRSARRMSGRGFHEQGGRLVFVVVGMTLLQLKGARRQAIVAAEHGTGGPWGVGGLGWRAGEVG